MPTLRSPLRTSLLLSALAASGCSSGPSPTSSPSAAVEHRTPDQILEDRLARAVADLHYQDRVRGAHEDGSTDADVDIRVPTVTGKLEMLVVHRAVLQRESVVKHCYDEALKKDANLRGTLGLNFVIEPTGVVSDVKPRGVLGESFVGSCISGAFTAMVFPRAEEVTRVGYLIVLDPPTASAVEPDPNGADAPPASRPKHLPRAEGAWPFVVSANAGFSFDKKPLEVPVETEKEPRIEPLIEAATKWQSDWTEKHPDRRFPGIAGVRIGWKEPVGTLKRITRSLAYAGWNDALVQAADAPDNVLALSSDLAENRYRSNPDAEDPPIQLHVEINETEVKLTWRKNWKVLTELRTMRDKLEEKLCSEWRSHGEHRLPNDPQADALVLHADDDISVEELDRAARAGLACTRQRAGRNGTPERLPVFWLTLSVK